MKNNADIIQQDNNSQLQWHAKLVFNYKLQDMQKYNIHPYQTIYQANLLEE